jgi:hypothetical protein
MDRRAEAAGDRPLHPVRDRRAGVDKVRCVT